MRSIKPYIYAFGFFIVLLVLNRFVFKVLNNDTIFICFFIYLIAGICSQDILDHLNKP